MFFKSHFSMLVTVPSVSHTPQCDLPFTDRGTGTRTRGAERPEVLVLLSFWYVDSATHRYHGNSKDSLYARVNQLQLINHSLEPPKNTFLLFLTEWIDIFFLGTKQQKNEYLDMEYGGYTLTITRRSRFKQNFDKLLIRIDSLDKLMIKWNKIFLFSD